MSKAGDMIDAGLEALHAVATSANVSYTEAGVAAQAVRALEVKRKVRGDDIKVDFVFRTGTLTISDTAWRGAQITGTDSKVYRIEERTDTPGSTTFTAVRVLERS